MVSGAHGLWTSDTLDLRPCSRLNPRHRRNSERVGTLLLWREAGEGPGGAWLRRRDGRRPCRELRPRRRLACQLDLLASLHELPVLRLLRRQLILWVPHGMGCCLLGIIGAHGIVRLVNAEIT